MSDSEDGAPPDTSGAPALERRPRSPADEAEAEAEAQDEEEEEPEAQGGGAAAEVVSKKKKKKKRKRSAGMALEPIVDAKNDRLTALRIVREGQDDTTIYRPEAGDHDDPIFALWRFADENRKRAKTAAVHVDEVHSLWCDQREALINAMRSLGQRPASDAHPTEAESARFAPVPASSLHDDAREAYLFGPARWKGKIKSLPDAQLARRIERDWFLEIVEDTADAGGRLYTPGPPPGVAHNGHNKEASLCGAFPHALVRHKVGRLKDKALFMCASTHAVVISVHLRRKGLAGPASERDLLGQVRSGLSPEEAQHGCGQFENSVIVYAELQFQSSDQDLEGARIRPDEVFKSWPAGGKLLSPQDSVPYAGGYQEVRIVDGVAEMQFSFNKMVYSSNLKKEYQDKLFQVAVWTLNPYLHKMSGFRKTSAPFIIKAGLHNDVVKGQRWVLTEGGRPTLLADKALIVREPPASRNTAPRANAAANADARWAGPGRASNTLDKYTDEDSEDSEEEQLDWRDQLAAADSEDDDRSDDPDFAPSARPPMGPPSDSDDPSESECESDVGSDLDENAILPLLQDELAPAAEAV
jgi:hypothetical protein